MVSAVFSLRRKMKLHFHFPRQLASVHYESSAYAFFSNMLLPCSQLSLVTSNLHCLEPLPFGSIGSQSLGSVERNRYNAILTERCKCIPTTKKGFEHAFNNWHLHIFTVHLLQRSMSQHVSCREFFTLKAMQRSPEHPPLIWSALLRRCSHYSARMLPIRFKC